MGKQHKTVLFSIFNPWSYTKDARSMGFKKRCPKCGAFHMTFALVDPDGLALPHPMFRVRQDAPFQCPTCHYRTPIFTTTAIPHEINISQEQHTIIHWSQNKEKVQVSSEFISVPKGVTVSVKRSRVVEHIVEINWQNSVTEKLDAGFKQLITISIQKEIVKTKGRKYQESESVEFTVELNGDVSNRYTLTWTDVWLTGSTQIQYENTIRFVPLRFREQTEFEVNPD